MNHRRALTLVGVGLILVAQGCGGPLLRLAKQGDWAELDREARARKRPPRAKAARAWATALVELGRIDEARAVLQRDFRSGGQEASLLALAELEQREGLLGIAAAHYTRLLDIDLDELRGSESKTSACELLRARAKAELALGEALAADTDLRRLALVCPEDVTEADRNLLSSSRPLAQDEAEGRRSLTMDEAPARGDRAAREAELAAALEHARKRGPRAVAALAAAAAMQVEAEDVAVLFAAEFAGVLGPGLVSSRTVAAWIGANDIDAVIAAIDSLPSGAREYALLRLTGVRSDLDAESDRQAWIVAAMSSLDGEGPHEAARAWRILAISGDLGGAEFALNTNLRDMIPPEVAPEPAKPAAPHWSLRVPVDRRTFDLLLTLARLFDERGQQHQGLELRRSVLRAGYDLGLAQVSAAATDEVRRALALGRPWQALAVAEVAAGPLLDDVLGIAASQVGLIRAAGLHDEEQADRGAVRRVLGEDWLAQWSPRIESALAGLDLGARSRCPSASRWLDDAAANELAAVGLDPQRSRAALEAAFAQLDAPETGAALVRAIESDLALSCSASLVPLLFHGPHALALDSLDERLIHVPELAASLQLQLFAEVALAHGELGRATLSTIAAAAHSPDPRALWARAAISGRDFQAREYTIEALRQVLLHTPGLDDEAARRELTLTRLRDVDGDELLRAGDQQALDSLREAARSYVDELPRQQRWLGHERLLLALAGETRRDARAWQLLLEAVLDARVRSEHAGATATLEAAARAASEEDEGEAGAGDPPTTLGDAASLCEVAADRVAPIRMIGLASTCSPWQRAAAVGALWRARPDTHESLRASILAGPRALAVDSERPATAATVPALERPGLDLRIVLGLPIDPLFVVEKLE